ncbi:unnamed protein product [Closterium sp. Naga37s-1]|nr:unnamed protein product [Closterium sp. Naga37s-1]
MLKCLYRELGGEDEVLALTGGEACEKGVEIAALVMDSVPPAVVGDPLRLRQVRASVCLGVPSVVRPCHPSKPLPPPRPPRTRPLPSPTLQILLNLFTVAVRLTNRDHIFLCVLIAPLKPHNLILLNLFTVAVRLTDRGHIFLCVRVAFDPPHKPPAPAAGAGAAAAAAAAGGAAGAAGEKGKGRDPQQQGEGQGEGEGGEEEKERAARGKASLMKGEHLTLSGLPAVDGSNSWPAVCEMLKQQENRLRKSPSGGAAAGTAGTAPAPASVAASGSGSGGGGSSAATAMGTSGAGARAGADRRRRGIRLLFSLEDTGAGLPGEVLAARERPFEAVHMKLQQKYAGVPLLLCFAESTLPGRQQQQQQQQQADVLLLLCFAERLVKSMSGQMSLSTRVNTGTTVTFDVLLDQPPPGATSSSTSASSGSSVGGVGAAAGGGGGAAAAAAAAGVVPRVFHIGYGAIGDDQHAECAGLRAKLRGMRCLVVDGRPVRQQVTATYLARMGLRVDLSDSVPAAALALRHSRHLPVRQQVTATYLARMGLRVDLSDSVPAAALALRHSRHLPVRQQVTATYLARMGLRVDLSDSVPAAALALRHSRHLPGPGELQELVGLLSRLKRKSRWSMVVVGAGQGLVNRKSRWDMVVVDADADGPSTGIELGRMVQQLKELREAWEATPIVPKLLLLTQVRREEFPYRPGTGIEQLRRMVQHLKELREA